MPGGALTKRYYAALDEREEEIFLQYAKLRSLKKVAEGYDIDYTTVYRWMNSTPERKARWAEAKKIVARLHAELAVEAAEGATPGNANAQRLKMDGYRWMAERQDPQEFGAKQHIKAEVGPSSEWLQAMLDSRRDTSEDAETGARQNGEIEIPPPFEKEGGT